MIKKNVNGQNIWTDDSKRKIAHEEASLVIGNIKIKIPMHFTNHVTWPGMA